MSSKTPSTIAQLLFSSVPTKPFAALVRDLDAALARIGGERETTWDHDDIVFMDMDGTRVGMSFADDLDNGHAACLTISVGPAPTATGPFDPDRHASLCDRIASRAAQSLGADQVIQHRVTEPVTVDLIDALIDALPPAERKPVPPEPVTEDLVDRLLRRHPFPEKTAQVARKAALRTNAANETATPDALPEAELVIAPRKPTEPQPAETAAPAAEAKPEGKAARRRALRRIEAAGADPEPKHRHGSAELAGLRDALYDPADDEDDQSNAQRIAAMTMNATLTIVMPPVGATLLASAWRQGVDLPTSARAMAITGAVFGFAHAAAAADIVTRLPF